MELMDQEKWIFQRKNILQASLYVSQNKETPTVIHGKWLKPEFLASISATHTISHTTEEWSQTCH